MTDKPKPKPKISKSAKEAEKTICANPRYEGLTIAEATRQIMQRGKKAEKPPEPHDPDFT